MDTVLGVSMAPTAVRMVLVEGENGDGALVEQDEFDVAIDEDTATSNATDQVISAILGTREGAAESGYHLTSTGVTWRDPAQAAELRDALATRKVENVMLVSAFLAAAALAQSVGNETNYAQTALLFIEPETATLAVVNSFDGSIADVHRRPLPDDDNAAVAQLAELVSVAEELPEHPDAVFVVGSGIDIPLIKPTLEAATTLPVAAAEEPDTALARGAALAAANTPLLVSSTSAQAYAQVHGAAALNPHGLDAAYFDDVSHRADTGEAGLAYSAVPGEDQTATHAALAAQDEQDERKPFALLGTVLVSTFVVGVTALVVSLGISIRSTSDARPDPGQNVVVPPPTAAPQAPETPPAAPVPTPQAPAPVPQAPAENAPVPQGPVNVPQVPATVPQAPVQVPQAPVPQAPAQVPAPVQVPAPAPIPVPIPVPVLPGILNPPSPGIPGVPGGGGRGGGGGGKGPDLKLPGGGGKGPGGGGRGGGGRGGGGGKGGGKGAINIPGIPGI